MADVYSNLAYIAVTETAANTLTFSQLTTGISTFSKQAFIIHRVEWFYGDRSDVAAEGDYFQAALVMSNKMSGIGLDDPSVVIAREWHSRVSGTPAVMFHFQVPDVDDFSDLPGGGLIIPANPIFLAAEGVSLAGAQTVNCRIRFTVKELKADEYIELVESVRMIE